MRNRQWEDRRRFESGRSQPSYQGYGSGGEMDRGDESQRWGQDWNQGDYGREPRGGYSSDREWSGGSSDGQRSPGDWGGGGYGSQYSRQSAFGSYGGDSGTWSSGGPGGAYDGGRNFSSGSSSYGPSRGQSSGYSTGDMRGGRSWMAHGRESGRHAGKGPKGYRRSDDRIKEEI
ncbi:MAG TPA: hypothetical protein VFV98_07010, partial [Vicinamibacterales bacterium]|nr:hypothetical protein [Vicinamibacterales bacterium]